MIHGGDVYCPTCGDGSVAMDITYEDPFWFCDRCGARWDWDHNGIDWDWPDDVDKPSPGCPYCGTQNIRGGTMYDGRNAHYVCMRDQCRGRWCGRFVVVSPAGLRRWVSRWTIRISARNVPFRRTLDNPTTYPHHQETP